MNERRNPVLSELLDLLQRSPAGVPKSAVESKLAGKFSQDECGHTIKYALDSYLIDLVVDYPSGRWGLPEDCHVWHYRTLSPESARNLRNLKPVDLALVKLLWQQSEPEYIGEMREKDAKVQLANQGFGEQELEVLWIDGVVDYYWAFEGDENIKWVRLIPEDEKTKEYKREEKKLEEWAARGEALHTRMAEEMEQQQECRGKRTNRYREKPLRRQST